MALTDTDPHPPTEHNTFVPPPAGSNWVDPTFGETITRVTDAVAAGREFLVPEYASTNPVNADDSLVRISGDGGVQRLYSLPSLGYVGDLGIVSSTPSDFWWHMTDPEVIYHIWYEELRAYNVTTQVDSTVWVSPYFVLIGHGENNLSHDGNRLCLHGGNDLVVWDFVANQVIATMDVSGQAIHGISMSPDGTRVIVNRDGHIDLFGITTGSFVMERQLWARLGHQDVGQSQAGDDYLVMIEDMDNRIISIRLSDGFVTTLLTLPWPLGAHVSASSAHNDGYAYVSTQLDADDPPASYSPYANELLRMPIDGGPVERLAHTRTQYDLGAGDTYYSVPRGTVARSGRYYFYASNMRQRIITNPNLPPDYADTYMLEFGQGPTPPMADIDNYKTGLTNAGIAFTEEPEMSAPTPTGNTLVKMIDTSGDEIVAVFDGTGMQVDIDAT